MSGIHHQQTYDGTTDPSAYNEKTDYDHNAIYNVDPYDMDHPKSMINMVPSWLKARMMSKSISELMSLSEEQLKAHVKPNLTLNRLRTSFWHEYERSHKAHGRYIQGHANIGLYRMCLGICTVQYFMDKIAKNDYYLAWIIRPPLNYDMAMQEALEYGLSRLREVLDFPLYKPKYNKDGIPITNSVTEQPVLEPDEKIANIVLKTVAFLDLRVKGSIPKQINQNIRSQNQNMNINTQVPNEYIPAASRPVDIATLSIEDIDKKIAQIEGETRTLMNDPKLGVAEYNTVIDQSQEELDEHTVENNLDDRMSDLPVPIPENSKKRY